MLRPPPCQDAVKGQQWRHGNPRDTERLQQEFQGCAQDLQALETRPMVSFEGTLRDGYSKDLQLVRCSPALRGFCWSLAVVQSI